MEMNEHGKMIFVDPISGETISWPTTYSYLPSLTRGLYLDKNGETYYVQMTQVWPPPQEEQEEDRDR